MRAVEPVVLGTQADSRHVLWAVCWRTGAGKVCPRLVREQRDQWPGNWLGDGPVAALTGLYGHEAFPQRRVLCAGLKSGGGCCGGTARGLLAWDGESLRERLVHENERHEAREALLREARDVAHVRGHVPRHERQQDQRLPEAHPQPERQVVPADRRRATVSHRRKRNVSFRREHDSTRV